MQKNTAKAKMRLEQSELYKLSGVASNVPVFLVQNFQFVLPPVLVIFFF